MFLWTSILLLLLLSLLSLVQLWRWFVYFRKVISQSSDNEKLPFLSQTHSLLHQNVKSLCYQRAQCNFGWTAHVFNTIYRNESFSWAYGQHPRQLRLRHQSVYYFAESKYKSFAESRTFKKKMPGWTMEREFEQSSERELECKSQILSFTCDSATSQKLIYYSMEIFHVWRVVCPPWTNVINLEWIRNISLISLNQKLRNRSMKVELLA